MRSLFFLVCVFTAVNGLTNLKLNKITVKIGAGNNDGTKDDVAIKICDQAKCCQTKELSHLLSREWVQNKTEVWDGGKLGNCSKILFESGAADLTMTLLKTKSGKAGKDDLRVSSIILEGAPTTKKTDIFKFTCGSFIFASSDTSKTQRCLNNKPSKTQPTNVKPKTPAKRPASPAAVKINKITVKLGAGNTDGTDDDVVMKICDPDKCCLTKELSHTLSREWVKNKTEVWDGRKLGNCSQILFDSTSRALFVTLIKPGKDDLKVSSIILDGGPVSAKTNTHKFTCGAIALPSSATSKTLTCPSNKQAAKRPVSPAKTQKPVAVKINKITVKMGAGTSDGTDDDVAIKICGPFSKICCHTKELSHFLSSEWVKNKTEVWDGGKLGNCSKTLFESASPALSVTLIKPGKDDLKVSSIILEGGPAKTNTHKFTCGAIALPASATSKTLSCKNNNKPAKKITALTPENVKIKQLKVQIGDDGTNDDVKIKVCSVPKRGAPVCCETGTLSTILHDDWSKLDNETWSGSSLGDCRDKLFQIEKGISNLNNGEIKITVDKKGKDPVKIKNIEVETETAAQTTKSFQCGPFSIDGKTASSPTFSTKTCADRSSSTASKVGACLRSGKNCGTASAPSTKPPFRSGSGK